MSCRFLSLSLREDRCTCSRAGARPLVNSSASADVEACVRHARCDLDLAPVRGVPHVFVLLLPSVVTLNLGLVVGHQSLPFLFVREVYTA